MERSEGEEVTDTKIDLSRPEKIKIVFRDWTNDERKALATYLISEIIGVKEDMSVSDLEVLLTIAGGMFWNKPFHIMALGLAEAVESEFVDVYGEQKEDSPEKEGVEAVEEGSDEENETTG